MKRPNKKKLLPSLILCLSLASCSTVQPPDVPVCEALNQHMVTDPSNGHLVLKGSPACLKQIGEPECGHCAMIVSGKEIYVGEKPDHLFNKKPWSQLKRESVFVPAVESYAPLATYIINSCKENNCNDQVDRFKIRLDSLSSIAEIMRVSQTPK